MASGPVSNATASGGQLERLALSPDARTLATIDYSGSVELLDTTTGKLRQTLTSSTGLAENPGLPGFPELAFSPDGNYLAVWDNPIGLEVWDLHTGASVGVFDGRTSAPPFTSFGHISGFDEGPYSQFVVSFSSPDHTVTVTGERATSPGASSSFARTATWSLTPSDWSAPRAPSSAATSRPTNGTNTSAPLCLTTTPAHPFSQARVITDSPNPRRLE